MNVVTSMQAQARMGAQAFISTLLQLPPEQWTQRSGNKETLNSGTFSIAGRGVGLPQMNGPGIEKGPWILTESAITSHF
jgi:hypothetical protein